MQAYQTDPLAYIGPFDDLFSYPQPQGLHMDNFDPNDDNNDLSELKSILEFVCRNSSQQNHFETKGGGLPMRVTATEEKSCRVECASKEIKSVKKSVKKLRTAKTRSQDQSYEGVSNEIIPYNSIRTQDVLFGRGKRAMHHTGNKYYQEVVSTLAEQYKNCNKLQKTALSRSIVYTIHSHGGRFLTPLSNDCKSWVEVNGLALRKKTSQALRDSMLKSKKGSKPKTTFTKSR